MNDEVEPLTWGNYYQTDLFSSHTVDIGSNSSAPVDSRADKSIWTHGDNAFRFNFLPDDSPALLREASPSTVGTESPTRSPISFTGQGSPFAFNFRIPPVEPMETTENPDTRSLGNREGVQQEKSSPPVEVNSPPEPQGPSKEKRKKRKSGKKKTSDCAEQQQSPCSTEGSEGGEGAELVSSEEQLNRQLDWCIEQLELGMRSQKGTPKQKEEATRALKTLRSSKAPLVKKRQVMRAMTGDYRKQMEEEKRKQHKLIQKEMASAQVKVVTESSKKCVFHRRAGVKTQTSDAEESPRKPEAQDTDSAPFVFTPSKEKFCFNFV